MTTTTETLEQCRSCRAYDVLDPARLCVRCSDEQVDLDTHDTSPETGNTNRRPFWSQATTGRPREGTAVQCVTCGRYFYIRPSHKARAQHGHHCSRGCLFADTRWRDRVGKGTWAKRRAGIA